MRIAYTHYIFQTLTYDRRSLCRHKAWWTVSKDTTAYVQKIRRYFGDRNVVEFLRVIEPHRDFYPHVHILFYLETPIQVENGRYFNDKVFYAIRDRWERGFSKPEVLRKPNAAFAYCLKYFLKQLSVEKTTKSTDPPIDKIWKLRGKRITWFALPIRILAWSKGMQKLYQEQQRLILVLRRNAQRKITPKQTHLLLEKLPNLLKSSKLNDKLIQSANYFA